MKKVESEDLYREPVNKDKNGVELIAEKIEKSLQGKRRLWKPNLRWPGGLSKDVASIFGIRYYDIVAQNRVSFKKLLEELTKAHL